MTQTHTEPTTKTSITPEEYAAGRDLGRTYSPNEYTTPGNAPEDFQSTENSGETGGWEASQHSNQQRGEVTQGDADQWSTTSSHAPQSYPAARNQAFATPGYSAAGPHGYYTQEHQGDSNQEHGMANVNGTERQIAVIAGGLLIGYALLNRSRASLITGAVGAALLWHGQSQRSPFYTAFNINTASQPLLGNGQRGQGSGRQSTPWQQGAVPQRREQIEARQEPRDNSIEIERAVTVNKPAAELYTYWRKLENLPNFMHHLQKVEEISAKQSHWEARMVGGLPVAWDAEIVEDVANERIAWRTLPDAQVQQSGVVTFKPASNTGETVVKVDLRYTPPGGLVGETFARLLNGITAQQVKDDIGRFKSLLETGEIATVEGQPSGRD